MELIVSLEEKRRRPTRRAEHHITVPAAGKALKVCALPFLQVVRWLDLWWIAMYATNLLFEGAVLLLEARELVFQSREASLKEADVLAGDLQAGGLGDRVNRADDGGEEVFHAPQGSTPAAPPRFRPWPFPRWPQFSSSLVIIAACALFVATAPLMLIGLGVGHGISGPGGYLMRKLLKVWRGIRAAGAAS